MTEPARILVWADAGQAAMIRAGVAASGTHLVGIGSRNPDTATELADALSCSGGRVDDLRQAIHREDIDLLWLAGRDLIEREERQVIRERNLTTISNEPIPGLVSEVMQNPQEARTAHFVPLMRHAPGIKHGLELVEQIRGPKMVSITVHRPPEVGSLFACLYDAMDLFAAFGLSDAVSSVDASLIGPPGPPGSPGSPGPPGSSSPPDLPADLEGSMTLHLRMTGGSSATITASNQTKQWFREVAIIGSTDSAAQDCLMMTDSSCAWLGSTGGSERESEEELPDSDKDPRSIISEGGASGGRASGGRASGGGLIGLQISRILEGLASWGSPSDMAGSGFRGSGFRGIGFRGIGFRGSGFRGLALCEAARLSCRTGQGESPTKILTMLKGP